MIVTVVGDDKLEWVPGYIAEYVAVIGSRRRNGPADLEQVLVYIVSRMNSAEAQGRKIVIVSGGASKGADRHAEFVVEAADFDMVRFMPRVTTEGSPCFVRVKALFDRNTRVVELAGSVAAQVHHDRNGGTEDAVKKALRLGRPVELLTDDGSVVSEMPIMKRRRKIPL